MAGDRQAGAQLLARVLEAADVVALPAMERDRDGREPPEGSLDINAPFRVLLLRTGKAWSHISAGRGHGTALKKGWDRQGVIHGQFCPNLPPHASRTPGGEARCSR